MEIRKFDDCYSFCEYAMILEHLLSIHSTIEIPVLGSSMKPTIRDGEYVCLRKLSSSPRVGMIAVIKHDSANVIHRIIKKRGDKIITRGDANIGYDGVFEQSNIIAEMVPFKLKTRLWRLMKLIPSRIRLRIFAVGHAILHSLDIRDFC